MKPYLLLGGGMFLLAFVAGVLLLPAVRQGDSLSVVALKVQAPCDLQQAACVARDTAGHSLRFSITPTPIPLMQDLTVRVEPEGVQDMRSTRLSVTGVNMYMGYQPVDLVAGSDGVWRGKLVLPVCSLQTMQWQASLYLDTAATRFTAEFPFTTSR